MEKIAREKEFASPGGYASYKAVQFREFFDPCAMSLFAALTRKWSFSVQCPGAGRIVYREGNHEYTFPIYQDGDSIVLVAAPSSQRIYYFFNWYAQPTDLAADAEARILPRIVKKLRQEGARVRILQRARPDSAEFAFHSELFESRELALAALSEAGYDWLRDFQSIDPIHDEYGLELGGIPRKRDLRAMAQVLQGTFPHWHHVHVCFYESGREPGWSLAICLFPPRSWAPGLCGET